MIVPNLPQKTQGHACMSGIISQLGENFLKKWMEMEVERANRSRRANRSALSWRQPSSVRVIACKSPPRATAVLAIPKPKRHPTPAQLSHRKRPWRERAPLPANSLHLHPRWMPLLKAGGAASRCRILLSRANYLGPCALFSRLLHSLVCCKICYRYVTGTLQVRYRGTRSRSPVPAFPDGWQYIAGSKPIQEHSSFRAEGGVVSGRGRREGECEHACVRSLTQRGVHARNIARLVLEERRCGMVIHLIATRMQRVSA